jgi:hypothetical protein
MAQLLLEKEVVERPALHSILNRRMTKDGRDAMQRGAASTDGAPIVKPA